MHVWPCSMRKHRIYYAVTQICFYWVSYLVYNSFQLVVPCQDEWEGHFPGLAKWLAVSNNIELDG